MTGAIPHDTYIIRQLLFTPCETKEQLAAWCRVFLDIDLPNCTVAEESNSNPVELMWELYNKARANDDETFARVMAYANRGGFKTLSASILEVAILFHLGRNIGHMAAILDQSRKSQEYVRNFLSRPYLRDFRVGQNVKKIEFCRYYNRVTGENLTESEWYKLGDEAQKSRYTRIENYIQIVICTMAGANGLHAEFMCIDELDVIPKQNKPAYEEAKFIADARGGMLPITLLTSTRKFSYGLVQREISEAAESGLHVRHWNVIDITEPCPPSRHLPNEPMTTLYVDDQDLRAITEADWGLEPEQTRQKFTPQPAYSGCVTCPLFAACKGRLATHQHSRSKMLKPISSTIQQFKAVSTGAALTQLLCRTPDESGLIYPKLSRDLHMKTASQIAEIITGKPQSKLNKADLLEIMKQHEVRWYMGVDFGFTHNFSAVLVAVFGRLAFVVTVITAPGLELDEKIAICEPLKEFNPAVFGDIAYPSDIKTFARRGFNMKDWSKYPGSVKGGIEVVRMKLKPAVGDPSLYFLADDPGVELLFKEMKAYHFITDAAGQISEEPDDEGDDNADALRYCIMNVFAPKGKILASLSDPLPKGAPQPPPAPNWIEAEINKRVAGNEDPSAPTTTVKKGRFIFDV